MKSLILFFSLSVARFLMKYYETSQLICISYDFSLLSFFVISEISYIDIEKFSFFNFSVISFIKQSFSNSLKNSLHCYPSSAMKTCYF